MSDKRRANLTWHHIFRDLIDSGSMANMGPHAYACYSVIKAYSNFRTGLSYPGIETIAAKSGMSKRKVIESLKILQKEGFLRKERKGRKNSYKLIERITMRGEGQAEWVYVPSEVTQITQEIKKYVQKQVDGPLIQAGTINISVQIGEVNIVSPPVDVPIPQNVANALEKFKKKIEMNNIEP